MFGAGETGASVMLVGEQPGEREDIAGHPSSLLRAPHAETRHRETERFVSDLAKVAAALRVE